MKVDYIMSRATKDDIVGIYNLLHRKFVKKHSPNSEKTEWKKHKKWYEFWLRSPYYLIFVIKNRAGNLIGQVRYEIDGEIAVINIFLAKEYRGKGLGGTFVEMSIDQKSNKAHDQKPCCCQHDLLTLHKQRQYAQQRTQAQRGIAYIHRLRIDVMCFSGSGLIDDAYLIDIKPYRHIHHHHRHICQKAPVYHRSKKMQRDTTGH